MASLKIIEVNNVIPQNDFDLLLDHVFSIPEDGWQLMNEPELNGEFWNGKRSMVPYDLTVSLQQAIFDLKLTATNFSAINKVQRFGNLDKLGPYADTEHVDYLKVGIIFFLNNPSNAYIEFPHMRYSVKAAPNKLVAYPASEVYTIHGPTTSNQHFYFSTIFGD